MYFLNHVFLSIAKSSLPSITFLISVIGSLITIQSGTHDLILRNNVSISEFNGLSIANHFLKPKIMDSLLELIDTNNGDCSAKFACEIGRITSENVPFIKFLVHKVHKDYMPRNSTSNLNVNEKIFFSSLMDPKSCDKMPNNCDLLREINKFKNQINQLMLTRITNITPTPIVTQSRSRYNSYREDSESQYPSETPYLNIIPKE